MNKPPYEPFWDCPLYASEECTACTDQECEVNKEEVHAKNQKRARRRAVCNS
jgi:hypothetical protein